jgi:predicted pyridoxine 5'-phosphate oxidase superfamily flavin-nucleotide-binding protein
LEESGEGPRIGDLSEPERAGAGGDRDRRLSYPGEGLYWAGFAAQAAGLAEDIARVVDHYRFALVATIRQDGTPRISTMEIHLMGDDLMVVLLPGTRKASDIRHDNRVTLQSPVINAENPGSEFKLRGRALPVEDEERRAAAADLVEGYSGWRPPPSWPFLTIAVADATHTAWRTDGTATMTRWTVTEGIVRSAELTLDWETGRYRSD